MDKTPVYIIGAQRSGTTLLRLMLTSHPQISIPPESLFFVRLEKKFGSEKHFNNETIENFLHDLYSEKKFCEWKIDKEKFKRSIFSSKIESYSDLIWCVYETYARFIGKKPRVFGEKNPEYLYQIPLIKKHFPQARFVHIIRDVRAIYNSVYQKAVQSQGKRLSGQMFIVFERWRQMDSVFESHKSDTNTYVIYYEKLLKNTEQELREICQWLQLPFSENMLDYHEKNKNRNLVPKRQMQLHALTQGPVDERRILAWQKELSESSGIALEMLNGRILKKHGYQTVYKCLFVIVYIRALFAILHHFCEYQIKFLPLKIKNAIKSMVGMGVFRSLPDYKRTL